MMRNDQIVRAVSSIALAAGYSARVISVGKDVVRVPGVGELSTFVILVVAIVTLASPETLEYIPFGPSRGDT